MLIDTCTHLNFESFENDYKEVIERALEKEIWLIIVGINLNSSLKAVKIAEEYPKGVYAAVGLHPLSISYQKKEKEFTFFEKTEKDKEIKKFDIKNYQKLLEHPKLVAIGEVGLDFHHFPQGKEELKIFQAQNLKRIQKEILKQFLKISKISRMPLILHCRDAHLELIKILHYFDLNSKGFDTRGIIHNFNGGWEEAKRYLNLDFLLSFTGLITHAHFEGEVIVKTPLKKIALETNSPYMTPEPYRTKRNEPENLIYIAEKIAFLKKEPLSLFINQVNKNVLKMFPKIRNDLI